MLRKREAFVSFSGYWKWADSKILLLHPVFVATLQQELTSMTVVSTMSCIASAFTGEVGVEKFVGPLPVNLFLRGGLGTVLDTLDALSSASNRRLRSSILCPRSRKQSDTMIERKSACAVSVSSFRLYDKNKYSLIRLLHKAQTAAKHLLLPLRRSI
jgi:hypothetical protein